MGKSVVNLSPHRRHAFSVFSDNTILANEMLYGLERKRTPKKWYLSPRVLPSICQDGLEIGMQYHLLLFQPWLKDLLPLSSKIKGGLDKRTPSHQSYLTILCYGLMDILSRLIEREVSEKRIDTFQVKGATSATHLIYANDVLIFSKANTKHSFKSGA